MRYLNLLPLILLSFSAASQSRVNAATPNVLKRTAELTNATGWALNEQTGKWIDNRNVIDVRKSKRHTVSHQSQNILSVFFQTVKVADSVYYALMWEKKDGSYKYKNIREDWREYESKSFMLLRPWQYERIKQIVSSQSATNESIKTNLTGEISSLYHSLGGDAAYTDKNLLSVMRNVVIAYKKGPYQLVRHGKGHQCVTINSQSVDGSDVVRFRLPESCGSYDYKKHQYFEVPLEEFMKLLSL
jgi:hypothetical protein